MNLANLEPERPGDLSHRAWGFREARLLQVAVRLELFTALERAQPCEAGALAAAIGGDGEMVERLLVSDGTSSTDMRTSGACSPVVLEDTVRLSLNEDAEVPRRGVSKERGRPGDEDENVEVW